MSGRGLLLCSMVALALLGSAAAGSWWGSGDRRNTSWEDIPPVRVFLERTHSYDGCGIDTVDSNL